MKVALLLLPSWSVFNLPLGIATVASIFRHYGHDAKALDLNLEAIQMYRKKYKDSWNHDHQLYWDDHSRSALWEGWELGESSELDQEIMNLIDILIEPILKESYDVIGMSIFGSNRKSTHYAAKKIKESQPDVKLLFGGPSAEHIFWINGEPGPAINFWLDDNDAAIIGEAERALPDLIEWWENPSKNLPKGVVFNRKGVPEYTPALISDFSESITPDYIDFDPQLYSQGEIPIEISRGCVGNCVFCTEKNIHHGYRTRSVANLIDIFKNGVNNKNIRKYSFVGSAINGNHKHFSELINKIIESGLEIEWDTSIRFDKRLNKQMLLDMAKSGCKFYNAGLESASPYVSKIMKKQIDLENVKQILKDSYDAGIKASVNIITGFPGEQEHHHIESLEFLKQIIKYLSSIHISPCMVYEGSQLALNPEKYNLDKNDMFPRDWKILADNNTVEIRNKRVKDFVKIANQAGVTWIAPFEENLNEREFIFNNDQKY